MSVKQTNPMAGLYQRLKAVGLTKSYIREMILPEWWEDDAAINPAAYGEGLSYLSRHLGLDLASLKDTDRTVCFREFGVCKFKKKKGSTEDQLALARSMATRAAQLAEAATTAEFVRPPASPALIRKEILGEGAPWVDLESLTDYCWSVGIPVLHVTEFPVSKPKEYGKAKRRPDGLAVRVNGRPVIVLCKRAKDSAWLLFILAHELGHIALGHIDRDGTLVDESMDDNEKDEEETAANIFAVELLAGLSNLRPWSNSRWMSADSLAQSARELGIRMRIDPGHLILCYAHLRQDNFWGVANAALNKLGQELPPDAVIRARMAEHLDWSALPEDHSDFLMRICGGDNAGDLIV